MLDLFAVSSDIRDVIAPVSAAKYGQARNYRILAHIAFLNIHDQLFVTFLRNLVQTLKLRHHRHAIFLFCLFYVTNLHLRHAQTTVMQ